jgi:hypothetical protein
MAVPCFASSLALGGVAAAKIAMGRKKVQNRGGVYIATMHGGRVGFRFVRADGMYVAPSGLF